MKKIRLGRKAEFYLCTCILVIGLIIFICLSFTEKDTNELIRNLIIGCTILIVYFLICLFVQEFTWFIKLKNNSIELKMPLATIQIYAKRNLCIKYAVKEYRSRGHSKIYPCLVIGKTIPDKIYFADNIIYKLVFEYYFLVVLDEKKLKTILSWYKEEIILPPKQEFENFSTKKIEKFYEIIKNHNESIQKD